MNTPKPCLICGEDPGRDYNIFQDPYSITTGQIWRAKRTKYTFSVRIKENHVNTLMYVGSAVI